MAPLLALLSGISGGTEWVLSFEGVSVGWALLGFLSLSAATVFAYLKLTPVEPVWRRYAMPGLRLAIFAVFFVLLVKPVLNLSVTEPVRQGLLVAVDCSQSMAVKDRRERPEDLARAAIAAGILSPDGGVNQQLPSDAAQKLGNVSRWELLQMLASNKRLNLWPDLSGQAGLIFYGFGRQTAPIGSNLPETLSIADAEEVFSSADPDQPATGIGDSLRQMLQQDRSRPVGGILLITDGQNNAGSSPLEAAQVAREQGVPLFVYGIGVTSPPDLILEEITTQKLSFVKERVEVRARIRTQGIRDKTVTVVLRADGVDKDEQTVEIGEEGERTIDLHFVPEIAGDCRLEVAIEALPEETVKENNIATTRLRVTDAKFHVLLIEQEPRWDFRYLLAYLQRDPRLEVKCVVIDGEPGLARGEDSVFLSALPQGREEFFKSEVLILGDVNPRDLGDERMEIIREWVEAGGGIIFLAGPKFDPAAYMGTPLEALLPVIPDSPATQGTALRSPKPFKLELTAAGETSPYLQMDADPVENRLIWDAFPGVKWTARVSRAKPGAEVLLVDSRPEVANRYGPIPVFARQGYGAGACVYFGTDETYRWRSGVGEKYYSILWGQIMQSLSLELLEGGSARTQLKSDRREYTAGDLISISGRAYDEGFTPLIAPSVEGTLRISTPGENGAMAEKEEPLSLSASSSGGFQAEFEAKVPGEYSFSMNRDPETVLRFEVLEPRAERVQTALNERLLRATAETAGGRFLREEDLYTLSEMIREKTAMVSNFKKQQLYHSTWWLAALVLLTGAEWFMRRMTQLK